ncbi:hypothetical protein C8J56DRAFT_970954 [Mycena floridula]|nr:hypothetical protein C8J56DRAFT_970954 [Mycena floridula]
MEPNASASPFAPFLNTNYRPSSHQLPEIQDLCSSYREEILHVEQLLQQTVWGLTKRLEELRYSYTTHSALLSPIRRVPLEILGEIFAHCAPQYPDILDNHTAPVLLSHVSHEWRSVANQIPHLWASFTINAPSCDRDAVTIERVLENWLAKTATVPLHIRVINTGNSSSIHFQKIADLLCSHAVQWKTLELKLDTPFFHLFRAAPLTPILENILIVEGDSLSERPAAYFSDSLPFLRSGPPLLRSLAMETNGFIDKPFNWPMHQLTHIVLRSRADTLSCNSLDILQLLQVCVDLVDFEIRIHAAEQDSSDVSGFGIVSMKKLNRLCFDSDVFSGPPCVEIFAIMKKIRAPALKVLDIRATYEMFGYYHDFSIASVEEFLKSSGCSLTALALREFSFDYHILVRCLALCPELMDLCIADINLDKIPSELVDVMALGVDDHLLAHLASSTACPKLRSLILKFNNHERARRPGEIRLLNFMVSKTYGLPDVSTVTPLVHLELHAYQRFEFEVPIQQRKRFVRRGLKFVAGREVVIRPFDILDTLPFGL